MSIASASSRLRGRVFQVGELAGSAADSANKVITGVVDSSWTALRGLIIAPGPSTDVMDVEDPGPSDAANSELRAPQHSTFSLANVTASVASIAAAAAASTTAVRNRSRADSHASPLAVEQQWGGNQEMIEVASRPDSARELAADDVLPSHVSDEESENVKDDPQQHISDVRSIRSVSSIMSREIRDETKERMSLSNRLATIGVLRNPSYGEPLGQNALPEITTSKASVSRHSSSQTASADIQTADWHSGKFRKWKNNLCLSKSWTRTTWLTTQRSL